jgi:hypothetical protein
MTLKTGNIQIVRSSSAGARCRACGRSLEQLGTFNYLGGSDLNAPRYRLEKNVCGCGKEFYMRYDFFDREGHINSDLFNGDINNASFQWQSLLTEEQLRIVEKHLSGCQICRNRHDEVILEDAAIGAVIRNLDLNAIGAFNE